MPQIRVRLMADDAPWPIWGPSGGPLKEDSLPLSAELVDRVRAWFNGYVPPVRADWPIWSPPSGLSAIEAEHLRSLEGQEIAAEMQTELGDDYLVVYCP